MLGAGGVVVSLQGVWSQGHDQHVVCYLGSWAVYRPGNGKFNIEDIDPRLCTTLVYAFTGMDENSFAMKSLDPDYDITKSKLKCRP
ncbi:hypothetical protein SK128_018790 [Halocaridina rubra]|uniref:GH18 domain-containing protein n=1 Tax=Halocaridina rubra TaxID=373956 RepID=A0AAN8X4T6_HALRR